MISDVWQTCKHPQLIYNKWLRDTVQVSCGKCSACLARKNNHYAPLIVNESACAVYTYFITLTYSDQFLPTCDLREYLNPNNRFYEFYKNLQYAFELSREYIEFKNYKLPCFDSDDIKRFNKRLRKVLSTCFNAKIRYFVHGDIGTTSYRPHYHAVYFVYDRRLTEDVFKNLVSECWAVGGKSIGRTDCQLSRSCARYVSTYINSLGDIPFIYTTKFFRPPVLFSQHFGFCWRSETTVKQIVDQKLTEIIVYDFNATAYKKIPLPSTYLYRYFPRFPSFGSLNYCELRSLVDYFRFWKTWFDDVEFRRAKMLERYNCDSWFRDYVSLNDYTISYDRLVNKLDVIYYAYKRLSRASAELGIPIYDYLNIVDDFYKKKYFLSLKKQFEYESRQSFRPKSELDSMIDISKIGAKSPIYYQSEYFSKMDNICRLQTKTKLNNGWLDLHPEYKQFHK